MRTMTSLAIATGNGHSTARVNYAAINQYLSEISRFQLLSTEETDRLARLAHDEADPWAGSQLVLGNLRLVVRVVMDFQKYWMDNFLDLIQEGNVGLMRAVQKFDPSHGVKFTSYAGYWIRAYILKFIMDNCRLVKIGTTQAQRKLFYRLNKEKMILESQGIEPSTEALSQRMQVKGREVEEMGQRLDNSEVSLETPGSAGGESTQKVFLSAAGLGVEEEVADQEFRQWLRGKIDTFKDTLNGRERVILVERLLADEPRTLTDIAEQFGVSRERIRQIESGLLDKLRELLRNEAVCP